MSSLCWECKYEHSDCKGNKQNDCPNFSENGAINYPKKIRELKNEINGLELQLNLGGELCEAFRNKINRLKAALKQAYEAYDIQGKQLLEALDRCYEDCEKCERKCRAWQNGFNAKGGNMSFDSVMMLRRIVEEVTPENCTECKLVNDCIETECIWHHIIKALEKQIWVSTKERLPNDMEIVNITWVNRKPDPYYAQIKDVPMVATGLMMNGEWYWFSCYSENISEYKCLADADRMDKDIEVIAWLPLPSPYKECDTE